MAVCVGKISGRNIFHGNFTLVRSCLGIARMFSPIDRPKEAEEGYHHDSVSLGFSTIFLSRDAAHPQFMKSEQCHYASTMKTVNMYICIYLYTHIFSPFIYIIYRICLHTILSTFPPTMMEVENGSLRRIVIEDSHFRLNHGWRKRNKSLSTKIRKINCFGMLTPKEEGLMYLLVSSRLEMIKITPR